MRDLAVLIPTRGRPENVRKVISAWDFTNAWDRADMVLIADADDPEIQGYRDLVELTRHPDTEETLVRLVEMGTWMPMVHKLNEVARDMAEGWPGLDGPYFALAFAGDDHLPQTIGWAERYLIVLRELGSGMVYGDDGYQGRKLSTEWAVTADVVRKLGRMVPADVEHMYCDNAMMDLFGAAGALRHLPEIRIEHMHPYAGKAKTDAQYQRVNHRSQFAKDRRAYEGWRSQGMAADVAKIRDLRKGRSDVINEPTHARPRVAGSGPRRVERRTPQRSGPTSVRRQSQQSQEDRTPRHFRNVRAATPEDIMMALADFAVQVPADQEIVELGVFQGRTALQLAWGASLGYGAHVTGIDPWDLDGNVYDPPFTDAESRGWAHHWVDSLGYADKIRLVQAFSQDVALTWDGKPVGLLFVDGDHTKEGARRDILTWAPHLAPGARIAVDDYGHPDWPGVGEAVDELVAKEVLVPLEVFHERLAVTRLARPWEEIQDEATRAALECNHATAVCHLLGGWLPGEKRVPTAITSEGVHPSPVAAAPESGLRVVVSAGELEGVTNASIYDLTVAQMKVLAKTRGIVLGARKDKRTEILQALVDGR
jgi:hypothetical protein